VAWLLTLRDGLHSNGIDDRCDFLLPYFLRCEGQTAELGQLVDLESVFVEVQSACKLGSEHALQGLVSSW